MSTLDDAIQAIRMGDREEGRQILEEMLESDEGNEQVWLWLSTVVDTQEDREVCLENVLALNPDSAAAQKGLSDLRAGRFNVQEMMSTALGGIEEEEEPVSGATFIDEFRRASEEDFDDDELVMPSTMAKSTAGKQAAKKKGGPGFKLNPRLIILAVLVLFVLCGLAGALAYNLFFARGEDSPSVEQTVQETPAGGGEVVPTEAPTPAEATPAPPTGTPTSTRVPLKLPTPKPTDLPTATATQVVAPTP